MQVTCNVDIDIDAIKKRAVAANDRAIARVSQQVLADCNEFCPDDQGTLINSSQSHSDLKHGLLVWSTPYARYLYYGVLMVDSKTGSAWARKGDNKIKTNTPLKYHRGGKLWCERARMQYRADWRKILENSIKREMDK